MDFKSKLKRLTKDTTDFLKAAFDMQHKSASFLRKEAYDAQDNFMLLCMGDLLGLPIPTSYYTIELMPYLIDDIEGWERRMIQRQTVWEEKWAQFGWDS